VDKAITGGMNRTSLIKLLDRHFWMMETERLEDRRDTYHAGGSPEREIASHQAWVLRTATNPDFITRWSALSWSKEDKSSFRLLARELRAWPHELAARRARINSFHGQKARLELFFTALIPTECV
jgi:hypothetical protein